MLRHSLWGHVAALVLLAQAAQGLLDLNACKGKKIGIIDLSELAHTVGEPTCKPEEVVHVNPANGIVYLANLTWGPDMNWVGHEYGTHSAPWFFYQALKSSEYYTSDLAEADVVFVYDYCYYIWWLAMVHTHAPIPSDAYTPGTILVSLLKQVVQTPRWKQKDGRDFALYDSHPGFISGAAEGDFRSMKCNVFKSSIHLVVEQIQRTTCGWDSYNSMTVLSTPYIANTVNMQDPLSNEVWDAPIRPLKDRNILLYSSSRCTPFLITQDGKFDNVGKKFRHDAGLILSSFGNKVAVSCTDPTMGIGKDGGHHLDFREMLTKMSDSIFCLALPGDAPSTRRLAEIFMAGCIPVFVGPPYNTAPLAAAFDYALSSLWFNVTNYHSWLQDEFRWESGSGEWALPGPGGAKDWQPEVQVTEVLIKVYHLADIVEVLSSLPKRRIESMLREVEKHRELFRFRKTLASPASAVDAMAASLCATTTGWRPTLAETVSRSRKPGLGPRKRLVRKVVTSALQTT